MATPDNANPVIHSTASAAPSTHGGLSWSLSREQDAAWEKRGVLHAGGDDEQDSDQDFEEGTDQPREPIDRDEIFGKLGSVSTCYGIALQS